MWSGTDHMKDPVAEEGFDLFPAFLNTGQLAIPVGPSGGMTGPIEEALKCCVAVAVEPPRLNAI